MDQLTSFHHQLNSHRLFSLLRIELWSRYVIEVQPINAEDCRPFSKNSFRILCLGLPGCRVLYEFKCPLDFTWLTRYLGLRLLHDKRPPVMWKMVFIRKIKFNLCLLWLFGKNWRHLENISRSLCKDSLFFELRATLNSLKNIPSAQ